MPFIQFKVGHAPRKIYARIAIPFLILSILLLGGSAAVAQSNYRNQGQARTAKGRIILDSDDVSGMAVTRPSDPCGLEAVECENERIHRPSGRELSDIQGQAARKDNGHW